MKRLRTSTGLHRGDELSVAIDCDTDYHKPVLDRTHADDGLLRWQGDGDWSVVID